MYLADKCLYANLYTGRCRIDFIVKLKNDVCRERIIYTCLVKFGCLLLFSNIYIWAGMCVKYKIIVRIFTHRGSPGTLSEMLSGNISESFSGILTGV